MPRFSSELAHLYTEEEAFEISHSPAFQGKIVSIRNIRALFHGESSSLIPLRLQTFALKKSFLRGALRGGYRPYTAPLPDRAEYLGGAYGHRLPMPDRYAGIFLPQALGGSDFREKGGAVLYFLT